jgi:lipopolysaccharide transport system ATP-binding protein
MSKPVVRVQNLGKRYLLNHQQQERHNTLRDALAAGTKSLLSRVSPSLRADRAAASSEEFWALKNVSFEINQGDRIGIIGRNGAGKSTLLKILSRITDPSCGTIKIKGRIASLLEVGTGFHPELSGRENIFLNGAILGMGKAEIQRKFDEIVAFAEVEKFLDTPVKHYSSGMYVRLAFAVAAHLEPEILIVDEVLAVGDMQFQKKCLGKMEDVGREGRTILFVSHNMATVKQLCTRALTLSSGQLIDDAAPAAAISRYLHNSIRSSDPNQEKTYHHIKGDQRAEITKISLNGVQHHETLLSIFEPLKISIDYVVHRPIDEFEGFVLIHSMEDGEIVANLFQRDAQSSVKVVGNSGAFHVSFENNLMPGKYVVSVGMFDPTHQFVDWVEYGATFSVESAFINGRPYDHRLGKFSLRGNWYAE